MNLKDNPWASKASSEWGAVIHALYDRCAIIDHVHDHCEGGLEAHHLVPKDRLYVRNDPRNGMLLCTYHHKHSKVCSPHMSPKRFNKWLSDNHPYWAIWRQANMHLLHQSYDFKKDYHNLAELNNTIRKNGHNIEEIRRLLWMSMENIGIPEVQ